MSGAPDIILILADDMGYSDLGCFGSEIRTPNLDRLGAGGLRFSQSYNCARCCPSMASLLTGLHPPQTGIGHMLGDLGHPSYRGCLSGRCVTLGEVLKEAGYRTYYSGKWHSGGQWVRRPGAWELYDMQADRTELSDGRTQKAVGLRRRHARGHGGGAG